jgi:hypothetical protein
MLSTPFDTSFIFTTPSSCMADRNLDNCMSKDVLVQLTKKLHNVKFYDWKLIVYFHPDTYLKDDITYLCTFLYVDFLISKLNPSGLKKE